MAVEMEIREAECLLGLNPPYTNVDVAAAHRKAIRENHPDVLIRKGVKPEEANERATRVNAARQVLLDELNNPSQRSSNAGASTTRTSTTRTYTQQVSPATACATAASRSAAAPAATTAQPPTTESPSAASVSGDGADGARVKKGRVERPAIKWIVVAYLLVAWSASGLPGLAYTQYLGTVLHYHVTNGAALTGPFFALICWIGTLFVGGLAKEANNGVVPGLSTLARWLAFAVFVCFNALFFAPLDCLSVFFGTELPANLAQNLTT